MSVMKMQNQDLSPQENVGVDYQKIEWPSATFDNLHPADAADRLENLSLEDQLDLIKSQSPQSNISDLAPKHMRTN